jgi:hypothetical protein
MSEIVISPSLARRAATAALAGLLSLPLAAQGQSLKDQIVGTWRLAAIYNDIGGNKEHLYGEKPMGLTMFDRSGNFLVFYSKPDLPKFAVANRVDGDIVAMNHLASSYPNRAGTVEKRTYKIAGDELTIVNPTAAAGGTSYQTLIRVK